MGAVKRRRWRRKVSPRIAPRAEHVGRRIKTRQGLAGKASKSQPVRRRNRGRGKSTRRRRRRSKFARQQEKAGLSVGASTATALVLSFAEKRQEETSRRSNGARGFCEK